jgi:hypothetical protein
MKNGTAPALMTTWVCSEVPEAMSEGGLAATQGFEGTDWLTGQSPSCLKLQRDE